MYVVEQVGSDVKVIPNSDDVKPNAGTASPVVTAYDEPAIVADEYGAIDTVVLASW